MTTTMLRTIDEVRAYLGAQPGALLVHVLPAEVFAAKRIPASKNACVYEVAFLSQIEKIAPDNATPLLLYGAGNNSQDVVVAAEKLSAAGRATMAVFTGGLAAWEQAGGRLEGDGPLPGAPVLDGNFAVNTHDSVVRWTGRNLFNHHSGTLKLAGGELHLRNQQPMGGRFTLDMNSIICEDIADPATNALLIRHLHDADFFRVDDFPTAEFAFRTSERIAGSTDGTPNWRVRGDFTLRGVTRAMSFPLVLAGANADRLTAQAQTEFDRTEFGSIYGSGRFFEYLGKHVVNDFIHLHVKLHADRRTG